MKSLLQHRGPWQVPYRATNVLCSDGKRRNARITGDALDAWSLPASVKVKGRTVSGFITNIEGTEDFQFHAYQYKKNGYLLP
jgi:hypothetical protein